MRGERAVAARDVVFNDGLEFFGDVVALQGDRALAVDEHRRGRRLAGARQADTDVRVAAFARPVPIDCATSATVTGPGYWRCEPSGNVICTIGSASWGSWN